MHIGIDEVGRVAPGRTSPKTVRRVARRRTSPKTKYAIGIDEVGRVAPGRTSPKKANAGRVAKWRTSPKTERRVAPGRTSPKYIVGIDEVGRGPLAGPVVVAAVGIEHGAWGIGHRLRGIRDSKKLTERQREKWAKKIKVAGFVWAVARVSPRVIDKIGISKAANLAAYRAYMRLCRKLQAPKIMTSSKFEVLLDGGLHLKRKGWAEENRIKTKTIIKGDEKIPLISAASIIAKVTRDKYMKRAAKQYGGYGFEAHKGYGTVAHYAAIKKLGVSSMHRESFLKGVL